MKILSKTLVIGAFIGWSTLGGRCEDTKPTQEPAQYAKPAYPLISSLAVNERVFEQKDLGKLVLEFRSTNRGGALIDLHPIYKSSHLFINGEEEEGWKLIASNGIRSQQFSALPVGKTEGFGCYMGNRFQAAGHYKLRWESPFFEPVEVKFSVEPAKIQGLDAVARPMQIGQLNRSAQTQPSYLITDLGTLGGKTCFPEAMNDAGQVVGASDTPNSYKEGAPLHHAFLWQNATMTDLGSLPDFPNSLACDINNKGQVLVNTSGPFKRSDPSVSFWAELGPAFLWQDGKRTVLPVETIPRIRRPIFSQFIASRLNDEGSIVDSHYRGINNKGQRIGNRHLAQERLPDASLKSSWAALFYDDSKEIELGTLGGNNSMARGLNDEGQVVGDSTTVVGKNRAFRWTNGLMVDLGVLPGFDSSGASAINNQGQVVGWIYPAAGETHAALWQEGRFMTSMFLFLLARRGSSNGLSTSMRKVRL